MGQTIFGGGGGGKGKGKGKGKWDDNWNTNLLRHTTKTTPDKVMWIGGLPAKLGGKQWKDANKELLELMKAAGCNAKFVDISRNGTGGAIFGSAEDVALAIATLAGTEFRGKTLEFDVWEKKPK